MFMEQNLCYIFLRNHHLSWNIVQRRVITSTALKQDITRRKVSGSFQQFWNWNFFATPRHFIYYPV